MKSNYIFFFVILSIININFALNVADFATGFFRSGQPTGFWPISVGQFDNTGQIVLAYADFNSDKFTDIVCMNNSKSGISILLWDSTKSIFVVSPIDLSKAPPFQIVSAIPADYNYDGIMDLLIIYNITYSNQIYYELQLQISSGCPNFKCQLSNSQYSLSDNFLKLDPIEPFLINPKGNSQYYIIYSKGGIRYTLNYQSNGYVLDIFSNLIQDSSSLVFPKLSSNHYASIIDFTGDCISDLILISQNSVQQQFLQFYRLNPTGNYTLVSNITMPYQIQKMSFSDINYDGSVDLLMIIIDQSKLIQLQINYNKKQILNICQGSTLFPFDIIPSNNTLNFIQRTSLPYNFSQNSTLTFGDVNTDGYPDLAIVLGDNNLNKPILLINSQCSGNGCGNYNTQFTNKYTNLRTFNYDSMGNIIKDSSQAISVSFFDLGQDGKMDIIINSVNYQQNGNASYGILPVFNNLNEDTFFIKALPLTKFSNDDNNKIINQIGITFQWKITTLQGNYKISLMNQLFQQTNRALQLPFILVGLGRTNNYLEDFNVCYPGQNNLQSWTPIIPNSQLMVLPISALPSQWSLGIYVSQSQKIKQVILITVIILIIIGIFIIYLNHKQKEEDKKNQFMFFQLIR